MPNNKRSKPWWIALSAIIVTAVAAGLAICISNSSNLHLEFSETGRREIKELDFYNEINTIEERTIAEGICAFIFTDDEDGEYEGAISKDGKSYCIGQVSMENTPDGLMGMKEVQVFGMRAVKFFGVLGANYAQTFYWLVDEKMEDSVIQTDGSAVEIDLDSDGRNEIVSTAGTIPETRIYIMRESKILVSDINKSIGAKSVSLNDKEEKLFEVYFEQNKPERYVYQNSSFVKK